MSGLRRQDAMTEDQLRRELSEAIWRMKEMNDVEVWVERCPDQWQDEVNRLHAVIEHCQRESAQWQSAALKGDRLRTELWASFRETRESADMHQQNSRDLARQLDERTKQLAASKYELENTKKRLREVRTLLDEPLQVRESKVIARDRVYEQSKK